MALDTRTAVIGREVGYNPVQVTNTSQCQHRETCYTFIFTTTANIESPINLFGFWHVGGKKNEIHVNKGENIELHSSGVQCCFFGYQSNTK